MQIFPPVDLPPDTMLPVRAIEISFHRVTIFILILRFFFLFSLSFQHYLVKEESFRSREQRAIDRTPFALGSGPISPGILSKGIGKGAAAGEDILRTVRRTDANGKH